MASAETDPRALVPASVSFEALASAGASLLRSPVSGQACVYWRVRIKQRVRVEPSAARIEAPPVLHREGTPGAESAAGYFGLAGPLSVEEVVIRAGEALSAEGILSDFDAAVGAGPLRGTSRGPELHEAVLTIESKSLAPVLLPWALGTAAALMSGMGLATYAAWRAHLLHRSSFPTAVTARLPRLLAPHAQLQPLDVPHPRMP